MPPAIDRARIQALLADLPQAEAALADPSVAGDRRRYAEALRRHAALFDCAKEFYASTDECIARLSRQAVAGRAVLLKGARDFRFEKLAHALSLKSHTTVLEVDLDAMIHNLNYFRSKLDFRTKLVAMVKAGSYGTGDFEVAQMLQHQGVDYLAVAFADEGILLRERGISMPIVVLNADAGFSARQHCFGSVDADNVLNFVLNTVRVGARQIYLVDDGNNFQIIIQRQVYVGQRLRLNALRSVDNQQRTLARSQRTRNLVGKIDVARRVNKVQHVFLPVAGVVNAAHGLRLNSNAALALQIHGV